MPTNTIQQLASITDAAQFERILTSVLRAANPSVYANLSHQGVNTDGKTVKAPLDNVGWTKLDGQSMIVAAAHTTASRDDLDRKWLHDPATVTPRKKGSRPTQPAGDLIKAIGEIEKLRLEDSGLKAILALTCNREEPTEVRIRAEALADEADIQLDIWSVSRIAQYLDTTADGQAIRHAYLGTPAVLLSKSELLRAGRLSLEARPQPTDPMSMINRAADIGGTRHVLLLGASGMGKTTLCIELLRAAIANGQPGIVLSDQTIQDATSLEEAIDIELRRYLSHLEPLAGVKALELCSELKPLVLVVEDINRAGNTVRLLNKLASWVLEGMSQNGRSARRNWRLLCPIWPQFLVGMEKSKDLYSAGVVQTLGLYSEKEAVDAVKRRGAALGTPQSDLAADEIARALGRDPLLIGLHEFSGTGLAQDVISEYVQREFANVALSSGLTSTDIDCTVKRLTFQMLRHRRLSPTWTDVLTWLGQEDDKKAMRALLSRGGVLRLIKVNGEEMVEPRHDRILHALLAASIAGRLLNELGSESLSDPFFCRVRRHRRRRCDAAGARSSALDAGEPTHCILRPQGRRYPEKHLRRCGCQRN
jgi:energy-coupling factor transporter ATP-binding protein EcfA2